MIIFQKPFDPDELTARVKNVINRQERLLKEAARFADIDVSKMAKQITEIKSNAHRSKSN